MLIPIFADTVAQARCILLELKSSFDIFDDAGFLSHVRDCDDVRVFKLPNSLKCLHTWYEFGQNITSQPNIMFERHMMALVILQIGLVRILKKGGVPFCAAVGHSYGEIAASYASDVITLREV